MFPLNHFSVMSTGRQIHSRMWTSFPGSIYLMPHTLQIAKESHILEESLPDETQRRKQTGKGIYKKRGNSGNECYEDIIKILGDLRGNSESRKRSIKNFKEY